VVNDKSNYFSEWYERNKEKKREYARRAYQKGTEKLRKLKSVPCADCGILFPSYVMQFDHLEDKKFTLSKSPTRKWEKVLEEIAKCEIVCANCHAIRTHLRWCSEMLCTH
jgi:hypothetical protein